MKNIVVVVLSLTIVCFAPSADATESGWLFHKNGRAKDLVSCTIAYRKQVFGTNVCAYSGPNGTTDVIYPEGNLASCPSKIKCVYRPINGPASLTEMIASIRDSLSK